MKTEGFYSKNCIKLKNFKNENIVPKLNNGKLIPGSNLSMHFENNRRKYEKRMRRRNLTVKSNIKLFSKYTSDFEGPLK